MKRLATVLVTLALTSGCANFYGATPVSKPTSEGMTRSEVRQRVGKPQKRFITPEGEVWIYHGGEKVLFFANNNRLTWSESARI